MLKKESLDKAILMLGICFSISAILISFNTTIISPFFKINVFTLKRKKAFSISYLYFLIGNSFYYNSSNEKNKKRRQQYIVEFL